MKELKFSKAVFHKGLNFTVRLGEKWKELVSIGDYVHIDGVGAGRIDEMYICKFENIPARVLELEHDEKCCTLDGLEKALWDVYYEDIMDGKMEGHIFTCLGFRILREEC